MNCRCIVIILTLLMPITFTSVISENVSAITTPNGLIYAELGDGTLVITGYDGRGGDVIIPDIIDGKAVSRIGDSAFERCYIINNVSFPNSLTSIGNMSFNFCIYLTSVTIPDNVTFIGYNAFAECTYLTSAIIRNSNTAIGNSVFSYCTHLSSVIIGDNVTSIGYNAFSCCSSLTNVTIGNGVTIICPSAFTSCTALTKVTIGSNVSNIGNLSFNKCSALASIDVNNDNPYYSSVDGVLFNNDLAVLVCYPQGKNGTVIIPSTVTKIGDYAFYKYSTLTSITIPDTVTSIGVSAFYYCTSLANLTIPGNITTIGDSSFARCTSLTSLIIPNSVTTIGEYAFASCTSLTSLVLGENVSTIGSYAFFYCNCLTNLTIPRNVTSIGPLAFSSCSALTYINVSSDNSHYSSVNGVLFNYDLTILVCYLQVKTGAFTIPDTVVIIGDSAFYSCTSLTNVTIPDKVTVIGDSAFESCSSLTNVIIGENVSIIGQNAFSDCTLITSIILPDSVTILGREAFASCTSLVSISIPENVTIIGKCAFGSCTSLVNINIPSNITIIDDYTFESCTSLVSIVIPDGVTIIGIGAFQSCSSLTSINIPDTVTRINSSAFEFCASLTVVTIGENVTGIGGYAFRCCTSLTSITIPNNVTSIGESAFCSCTKLTTATLGKNVTSIGYGAFWYCDSLSNLTIGDNVTDIGTRAFCECTSLKNVILPNNITIIDDYAFRDCFSLSSITIPNNVIKIGDYAFAGGKSLTDVIIGDNVTIIGDYAFNGCPLTSVIIPDSVISIGDYAFSDCPMTSVIIGDNVTSIGKYVFHACYSLTSVIIGEKVTSIGDNAFSACTHLTSMTFKGDAPIVGSNWVYNHNANLKIYYFKGAIGFSTPLWNSISTVECSSPSAPITLKATAGDGWVELTWTKPAYGNLTVQYYIIYQDGEVIGTTISTNITIVGLVDGQEYAFSVAAHNLIGDGENTTRKVTPLSVTITSPLNGSFTNNKAIEWTYIGNTSNATVIIIIDGDAYGGDLGSAFSFSWLSDGLHTVIVKVIDADGNIVKDNVTFNLDATAPTLYVLSPVDGSYNPTRNVTVIWHGEDASGIAYYTVSTDRTIWQSIDNNNSFSFADLTDGEHALYVRAYDRIGNFHEVNVTFIVDTTSPIINITTPNEGAVIGSSSVTISWVASDASSSIVKIEIGTDNSTWMAASGNEHVLSFPNDGSYIVYIKITDGAGNLAYDRVTFMVDTTAPSVKILSPLSGSCFNVDSVTITWSVDSGASDFAYYQVSIDGASWKTVGDKTNLIINGLSDGHHTVHIRAFDNIGNFRSSVVGFTIDTISPIVDIISPAANSYSNSLLVMVRWETSDATSGIIRNEIGADNCTWNTVSKNESTMSFKNDGTYTLYVRVTDGAGNIAYDIVTFTIDTVAPSITVTSPDDGSYDTSGSMTVSWEAYDETPGIAYHEVSIDGIEWTDVNDTECTFYLDDGNYTVHVRVYDLAGNCNSTNVTFIVDATAPTTEVSPTGDEVDLDAFVIVQFSEAMNQTATTISINGTTGTLSWNGNKLTFVPSSLTYNSEYSVAVTGQDIAGNIVSINWSFNTTEVGSIEGILVDENGNVMSNVTVSLSNGDSTVTDAYGRFLFANLTLGNYTFTVTIDGYEVVSGYANVTAGQMSDIGDIALIAISDDDRVSDDTILMIAGIVLVVVIMGAVLMFLRTRKRL